MLVQGRRSFSLQGTRAILEIRRRKPQPLTHSCWVFTCPCLRSSNAVLCRRLRACSSSAFFCWCQLTLMAATVQQGYVSPGTVLHFELKYLATWICLLACKSLTSK